MKHREGRHSWHKRDYPTYSLGDAGRRARVARWFRQPTTLAVVAVVVVAAGGIVTWQVAAQVGPSQTSGRIHSSGLSPISLPPESPGASDRGERASRGTPRQPVPEITPTPQLTPMPTPTPHQAPAPVPSRTVRAPAPPPPAPPAAPTPPPAAPPSSPAPTTVGGAQYVPVGESFSGEASYYGDGDGTDGGPTASGETFDANALTAAHPSLPFDTLLNVCYQGRCVVVRINDRGPFVAGRILDLSAHAAEVIGMREVGVAVVTATPVELVS